jgi:putative chitinase
MNRSAFFDYLRRRDSGIFGTSLSASQVQGVEAILDVGRDLPLSWLAYTMATAYGETGGRMQPITENMNYTSASRIEQVFSSKRRLGIPGSQLARNPQKLANTVYSNILGNGGPETGDGWRYRGHGLVQLTGKDNFRRMSRLVGVDLVAHPDRALEPAIAAKALIVGVRDGIYTGKKAADYLPATGHATTAQFTQARRIINGTFEAAKYAGYAMAFQIALQAAEYAPQRPREVYPARPTPKPAEAAPAPAQRASGGIIAIIAKLIAAILKGKAK